MLWIANLTAAAVEVTLAGPSPATARGAVLDAQSFARATGDPEALAALARPLASDRISLDGYAVARIDWPSA